MSLCVFYGLKSARSIGNKFLKPTNSILPFPFSLTARAYDVSKPVVGSVICKNAWCGLFGFLSSCTVRRILSVSEAPS